MEQRKTSLYVVCLNVCSVFVYMYTGLFVCLSVYVGHMQAHSHLKTNSNFGGHSSGFVFKAEILIGLEDAP